MSPRIFAMVIGVFVILLGVQLFILNLSGVTDITITYGSFTGQIAKGTPGAVLAFLGTMIVIVAILAKEEVQIEISNGSGDTQTTIKMKKIRRIKRVDPENAIHEIEAKIKKLEDLKEKLKADKET